MHSKKLIIAPLNWGLGHATRCIPIIKTAIKSGFTPVIASDGNALCFLQKEFPNLEYIQLPSYNISYGKNLRLNLIQQLPAIWKVVRQERQLIEEFVRKNNDVVGIISDNRFGVRSSKVTSIYVTHQLRVFSGVFTKITSFFHQNIIKKFDECWVPDTQNSDFSGELSHWKTNAIPIKFIGILSRFQQKKTNEDIDVLAIVSGVEPNRTFLEKKLKKELIKSNKKAVLVCGNMTKEQTISEENNLKIYNFVLTDELESLIQRAKIMISRSGYSSIMDLAVLQKKVFLIPTKYQDEQEYLANFLSEKKLAPFVTEEEFTLKSLENIDKFAGLSSKETRLSADLFSLFQGK